jgi:hypothetical protein
VNKEFVDFANKAADIVQMIDEAGSIPNEAFTTEATKLIKSKPCEDLTPKFSAILAAKKNIKDLISGFKDAPTFLEHKGNFDAIATQETHVSAVNRFGHFSALSNLLRPLKSGEKREDLIKGSIVNQKKWEFTYHPKMNQWLTDLGFKPEGVRAAPLPPPQLPLPLPSPTESGDADAGGAGPRSGAGSTLPMPRADAPAPPASSVVPPVSASPAPAPAARDTTKENIAKLFGGTATGTGSASVGSSSMDSSTRTTTPGRADPAGASAPEAAAPQAVKRATAPATVSAKDQSKDNGHPKRQRRS